MNQNSGAYVFRDENNKPILIAYKKLQSMKYLTLLHYNKVLISYYTNYHALLDIIPIKAISIYAYLPILSNRRKTIENWYNLLVIAMEKY